jgi:hypothetical protein
MPRDRVVLPVTLRDLDRRVDKPGRDDRRDEDFRDLKGQPVSDAQVIALARRIEDETGQRIVFEPPRA